MKIALGSICALLAGCATNQPDDMAKAVCPTIKHYTIDQAKAYLPSIEALPKPAHDLFLDLTATRTTAERYCGFNINPIPRTESSKIKFE